MASRRHRGRTHNFMKLTLPVLGLLVLFFTSTVFAQAQTRVRIIQASNVGSTIDPSLKDVHGQLGSLFNFTSYRLLSDEQFSLSENRPVEISAHQGIGLEINLVRKQKDLAEYRIKLRRDGTEILNTQGRLSPGRSLVIGGPKHGDGTIILAISARF
jgi:hypothetical protein